jgi:hypothetical protein
LLGYGYAESSNGAANSSATNYLLVQIRRIDNEQVLWLNPVSFDENEYLSMNVNAFQPGPALVTAFVNGIPSLSKFINFTIEKKTFLPLLRR